VVVSGGMLAEVAIWGGDSVSMNGRGILSLFVLLEVWIFKRFPMCF
jgi:hypothetical protein